MKRLWLIFSQTVTVLLAAYFVTATLKPEWLGRPGLVRGSISVIESGPASTVTPQAGSLSAAAKKASPAVVSINTSKAVQRDPRSSDPWFRFFFGDQGEEAQTGLGALGWLHVIITNQSGIGRGYFTNCFIKYCFLF